MFGISLDAFSVAGGFVLAWMGFGMLKGDSPGADESAQDQPSDQTSLTPLILFAASPGTITGVITLAVAHSRTDLPVTALVAIAVTIVVTFCVMLLLAFLGGKKQGGFFRETVTHFMGLIVVAMGVQFALTGFKAFMS
jgi:multiple antibiotic resistance protein